MNLILYGFKSCGKTTIGQDLAKSMNCPFYDTDQLIENLYQITTGMHLSVRNIFKTQGELYFRKLETKALFTITSVQNSIIAVGGGCILNPINKSVLERMGKLIYLKTDKQAIKERIFSNDLPPLLDLNNPEISFEQIFNQRALVYEQISAHTLVIKDQKDNNKVISKLKALSKGFPDG